MSSPEIAQLLHVAESTIRRLAAKGVIIKISRGTYDTAQSITGYAKHMQQQVEAAGEPRTVAELTASVPGLPRPKRKATKLRTAPWLESWFPSPMLKQNGEKFAAKFGRE